MLKAPRLSVLLEGSCCALYSVAEKHRDCHWTHTPGNWSDMAGMFAGLLEVDIPYQPVASLLSRVLHAGAVLKLLRLVARQASPGSPQTSGMKWHWQGNFPRYAILLTAIHAGFDNAFKVKMPCRAMSSSKLCSSLGELLLSLRRYILIATTLSGCTHRRGNCSFCK